MPEAKDLHVDKLLTDFSVKYRNEEMIWPFILPIVKVTKRSDKFMKYTKEDGFRLSDDRIGPKSMPNEVDWGATPDNYAVIDHALADWLPQETIDNADDPVQPEIDTVDFLNELEDVAQEKRASDLVFNATSYPVGNKVQLAGNDQWGGNSDDPIQDVLTAVEGCFKRANTIVFGADVWKVYRALPEVLDAVKSSTRYQGSPGGLASSDEVAGLFEVERVIVGRSRYISSKEGQAATFARLWGKHVAALHVVPKPTIKSITFGVTFAEMLREIQRDFDKKRGIKGAHFFKIAWNSIEKLICTDLGYFIEDAVA